MCGISGMVVPPGARVERELLERMNDTLFRRGPDDSGYFVDDLAGVGLGHRRLSVIDLVSGHQPLATADGRVQVVVNGEIYNFKALREELIGQGYRFKTNSDCEVVAHGWDAWGVTLCDRIQGMFALAVWDGRKETLFLARDRMGKKPLYYAELGLPYGGLIFASELKALLQHPGLVRTLDPTSLAAYLTYECVPEEATMYQTAKKLLPGTSLLYERRTGRSTSREFWRMRFASSPALERISKMSEVELVEELRHLIRESTRDRLIADVPLGVFLSGGLDSSTVTAAMADVLPGDQIKTFSISFEDPSFDESSHARRVAKHLGTDHHEERLSPQVMLDIVPQVADFMCEPLGDASVIPTYLLSRFTRRTVTVALGGDGGDELFLGYPTFQADALASQLDRVLPLPVERALGEAAGAAARLLPVSRKNFSFDFKLKRFAQGLGYTPELRHQAWMGSFLPAELARVIAEPLRAAALAEDPYALISRIHAGSDARDRWDRAMLQYSRLYLSADVLVKVDRASMACSLEVRAPLLDTRLVEAAAAIRGEWKLRGLRSKYLLKEAARRWLPAEIIDRPKKGFGVPIGEWLRGPLRPLARDLLAPEKLAREGLFDATEVGRLLDEHEAGQADHRKPLYTLLAFQLWHERFGPSASRR